MRPPFFNDTRRSAKPMKPVSMTAEEAALAIEALRHVGREIFDRNDKGQRLADLATAIEQVFPS